MEGINIGKKKSPAAKSVISKCSFGLILKKNEASGEETRQAAFYPNLIEKR